ncbi:unnamed protein product, partial [Thlaspi arvense]
NVRLKCEFIGEIVVGFFKEWLDCCAGVVACVRIEILDSVDFFKYVGQVVHVRLRLTLKGKHMGRGFVEFASADEEKKALEKKNGEYLHKREIFLDVAN